MWYKVEIKAVNKMFDSVWYRDVKDEDEIIKMVRETLDLNELKHMKMSEYMRKHHECAKFTGEYNITIPNKRDLIKWIVWANHLYKFEDRIDMIFQVMKDDRYGE